MPLLPVDRSHDGHSSPVMLSECRPTIGAGSTPTPRHTNPSGVLLHEPTQAFLLNEASSRIRVSVPLPITWAFCPIRGGSAVPDDERRDDKRGSDRSGADTSGNTRAAVIGAVATVTAAVVAGAFGLIASRSDAPVTPPGSSASRSPRPPPTRLRRLRPSLSV